MKPNIHEKPADSMGGVVKPLAMESDAQGILDEIDEAGEFPRDLNKKFWNDVYFELPVEAQHLFQKQVKALTGFKPSDVIGTAKDNGNVVATDWQDVADADGKADRMPTTVENLEGGERGYVALMRDAVRHYEFNKNSLRALEDAGQKPMFKRDDDKVAE